MIIFSSLRPDGLYREDPYSGNILLPPNVWNGDKWPFDDAKAMPFIPKVPCDFPNIPRNIKTQEELTNWLNQVHPLEKKNYKWETLSDGGSRFTLELAGRSKESVAVEIKNERWIVVSSKAVATNAAQIGGTYDIPSPDNLKLDAAQLTMEHGLLTVIFPVKKVEKKSITLL